MRLILTSTFAALLSTSAFAMPYTLSGSVSGLSGSITDTNGHVAGGGSSQKTVSTTIGGFNMTIKNDASPFDSITETVYCTDIFNTFTGSVTLPNGSYSISTTGLVIDDGVSIGATKSNQIIALLANAPASTPATSAALQASVWEIENESGTTGYSLSTGVFSAALASSNTTANKNSFAAAVALNLANVTNGTWTIPDGAVLDQFLYSGLNPAGNQSFVFLDCSNCGGGGGGGGQVPEPMSLALLGVGILGLAAFRRYS